MRALFITLRIVVSVAIIAAVIGQIFVSLDFWRSNGVTNIGSNVVNFLSFFTIDSNIAAAAILLIGVGLSIAGRMVDPVWFAVSRASVTTYMVVTGIVYNLLLRGVELPQGSTLGWSNEVLHLIAPTYLLIDWLFAPGRRPLGAKRIWPILVFPLVWVVYTLLRGPFVLDMVFGNDFWYPYPFLNPNTSENGYLSVAFYVVLIAAVVGLTAAGLLWISRRRSTTA